MTMKQQKTDRVLKKSKRQAKRVYYDSESDALWFVVKKGAESDSKEIVPGVTIEYGQKGEIIGLEILNASFYFDLIKNNKRQSKIYKPIFATA